MILKKFHVTYKSVAGEDEASQNSFQHVHHFAHLGRLVHNTETKRHGDDVGRFCKFWKRSVFQNMATHTNTTEESSIARRDANDDYINNRFVIIIVMKEGWSGNKSCGLG